MTERLGKYKEIYEGLEKIAKLSKKDLRCDYTLGKLMGEAIELGVDKGYLVFVLDEELRKKATQVVDDRLKALYAELDRREKYYVGWPTPIFAQNNDSK